MSYTRVLPRDLFNEAKLLKCWGQLALLVHEYPGKLGLEIRHNESHYAGFDINQRESDGGLYTRNLYLFVNGRNVAVYSAYNSKSHYPFYFDDGEDGGPVFTDAGEYSDEFTAFCNTKQRKRA